MLLRIESSVLRSLAMMNLIAMIALNVNEFILMIVRNKSRQRVQSTKVGLYTT